MTNKLYQSACCKAELVVDDKCRCRNRCAACGQKATAVLTPAVDAPGISITAELGK